MKRRFPAQLPSRRGLAALASAVTITALTSSCAVFNPIRTDDPYAPADGVQTDLGVVAIRDLLLVKSDDVAVLSGALINNSGDEVTVQIEPTEGSGSSEVQLQPREHLSLASRGLELTGVNAAPGYLAELRVTSSEAGATVLQVPVLPPELHYATITPAPTTPATTGGGLTPEPTPTSAPAATSTPAATG